MPLCVICKSRYYHSSYSSPAEPCDCGNCVSQEAAWEMDPSELAQLRAEHDAPAPDDDDEPETEEDLADRDYEDSF